MPCVNLDSRLTVLADVADDNLQSVWATLTDPQGVVTELQMLPLEASRQPPLSNTSGWFRSQVRPIDIFARYENILFTAQKAPVETKMNSARVVQRIVYEAKGVRNHWWSSA